MSHRSSTPYIYSACSLGKISFFSLTNLKTKLKISKSDENQTESIKLKRYFADLTPGHEKQMRNSKSAPFIKEEQERTRKNKKEEE